MIFDWDDEKSELNQRKRGYSHAEVSKIFLAPHFTTRKNDEPEQWIAVGPLDGKLITIVYEDREDEAGEFTWIVTYWYSDGAEEQAYANSTQSKKE